MLRNGIEATKQSTAKYAMELPAGDRGERGVLCLISPCGDWVTFLNCQPSLHLHLRPQQGQSVTKVMEWRETQGGQELTPGRRKAVRRATGAPTPPCILFGPTELHLQNKS